MQQEDSGKGSSERDNLSEGKSRAFGIIEQRVEKRRRRASLGKLISYIIALILVILIMLWLRRMGT